MFKTIVFLPLVGFLIAGIFGRQIGTRASQVVTSGLLVISAILSISAFIDVAIGGNNYTVHVANWVSSGSLEFNWALKIDTLTAVMLVVVTLVSAIVHIYSVGYMSHDPHNPRFFAYLSLFTFAMLMLVTADSFLQMFFGWEGVGLASYLLIGFWYKKPSANAAAIKAFLVNRVGDFGFSLGIFATFLVFGSVHFDTVFAAAGTVAGQTFGFLGYNVDIMTTICLLLFVGAMGKSAQLGLHTWLPDAMEGPTPVSALIHAATMVTAGVFLVVRCSPMFEHAPIALDVVTVVGASTAIFAASVGLVQNDIKRVIAYSTCSQLGYMFFAVGVGAYGAAMFHLFTHAFFKALLFLGAGSVIHACSDEQDMRKMGGIREMVPATYVLMIIGTLALTGFPGLSGFFSKDMVIEAAWAAQTGVGEYAFVLGVLAALMTSFYSWRLIFMTFHGKNRGGEGALSHVHESGAVMLLPLVVLALGALGAGYLFYDMFVGDGRDAFWGSAITVLGDDVIDAAHHVPLWVKLTPLVMMISGFLLAFVFYIKRTDLPGKMAAAFHGAYKFVLNKWYFDELFDFLFVRPAFWLGRFLWKQGDGRVIDGFGPDGVSALTIHIGRRIKAMQTGYLYHYAFAMLIGVVLFVSWLMAKSGGACNMVEVPYLSFLLLLPLIGAGIILLIQGDEDIVKRNARNMALITTLATFVLSLFVWAGFDNGTAAFQFVEHVPWVGDVMSYHLGVDGISILFVILTTFLMPICILASWKAIDTRVKEYMVAFLVLETLMIGVFTSLDIFLFYIFFEGGLIPMFLIIGVWGGARRVYASYKFFLYTLLGSVFMLVGVFYMVYTAGTTSIPDLMDYGFLSGAQNWLWLAFFASFAVKMPMWPVHTWLPDAHVEAPTAGSVILAGVLLKMGGYGFLRFSIPMFPLASQEFAWLVFGLSLIAVVYTSLVALAQEDMKKLIAYSSVAHMGFVTIGIFVMNTQGVEGAIFQMLSHGIVSGALFLCVGVVYDRLHTREIARYGGLVHNMPHYAVVFMIFTLAAVGLPGTSGFVGEILVLFGAYEASSWIAFIAATGVVLGAAYMLYLYRRVVFGELEKEDLKGLLDLDAREIAIFAPLVALVLWMGIYPSSFLDVMHVSVDSLIERYDMAIAAADAASHGMMQGGSH